MATGSLEYLKEELGELDRAGTALHPRVLDLEQRARTRFDGRDVINLASNNYLGLAAHPRLKEAASDVAASPTAMPGRNEARMVFMVTWLAAISAAPRLEITALKVVKPSISRPK